MKQDVTILGGPSDGMKLSVRAPLAATMAVTAQGAETMDYHLVTHSLSNRQVYAHPAVYTRLILDQGRGEGQSTQD